MIAVQVHFSSERSYNYSLLINSYMEKHTQLRCYMVLAIWKKLMYFEWVHWCYAAIVYYTYVRAIPLIS